MKKEIAEKISEKVSKMIEDPEFATIGYGPHDKNPVKIQPLSSLEAMEMVRVKWDGENQLYVICKGDVRYEAFLKPDGERLCSLSISRF